MTVRLAIAAAAVVVAGGAAWLAAADPKPAWELVVPERVELAPGVAGMIPIDVVPGAGRTVSRDGPLRMDVAGPDGVAIPRRRLSLADAVDPGAAAPRFSVKVTSAKPGRHEVAVAVRLWLCVRQTCKPVRARRTITLDVVAPPAPDAAPPADAAPPLDARKRPRGK